jgi:hypothetical protein
LAITFLLDILILVLSNKQIANQMATFNRLVRFEDATGKVSFGEIPADIAWDQDLIGLSVELYEGAAPWDADFHLTKSKGKIAKILSPIPSTPIVYGIGLNYRQHAEEAKVKLSCSINLQGSQRV